MFPTSLRMTVYFLTLYPIFLEETIPPSALSTSPLSIRSSLCPGNYGKPQPILPPGGSHKAVPAGAPASNSLEPRTLVSGWTYLSVFGVAKRGTGERGEGESPIRGIRRNIVRNVYLNVRKSELTRSQSISYIIRNGTQSSNAVQ